MLKSCPDVPRMISMQISAAITDKSIIRYISACSADNSTNKVSRPMFSWLKIVIKLLLK